MRRRVGIWTTKFRSEALRRRGGHQARLWHPLLGMDHPRPSWEHPALASALLFSEANPDGLSGALCVQKPYANLWGVADPIHVAFEAGTTGAWRIESIEGIAGDRLPMAARLAVIEGHGVRPPVHCAWVLLGVTSNTRYTNRAERDALRRFSREYRVPRRLTTS